MTRASLAVVVLAAATSSASAGTYVGLGIGSTATMGGDMTQISGDGTRSERFLLGQSWGRFSVEGAATRYGALYRTAGYDGTSVAVAGKATFPVMPHVSVFGRLGLQRTWLSTNRMDLVSFDGNGYLLGAGLQYDLDVSILGGVAIFADYQHTSSSFQGSAGRPFDSTASMWTLGLTVSM